MLIVDDARVFRRAARELLERRGYIVVGEADSGLTGLTLADHLAPDTVLLDVQLPDSTGFEVAAAMMCTDRPPAVLLMTADPCLRRYAMLKQSGARGLVGKSDLACTDLTAFWPAP